MTHKASAGLRHACKALMLVQSGSFHISDAVIGIHDALLTELHDGQMDRSRQALPVSSRAPMEELMCAHLTATSSSHTLGWSVAFAALSWRLRRILRAAQRRASEPLRHECC